jgi:hypothetical protein
MTHRIFQRTDRGRAALLEEHELPAEALRLLMRLNGYTPLDQLLGPDENRAQALAALAPLLEAGLAEPVTLSTPAPRPSAWSDWFAGQPVALPA